MSTQTLLPAALFLQWNIKLILLPPYAHPLPAARVKKTLKANGSTQTKFKVRCKTYLYTLVVEDSEKAEKLKQSLPPSEY